jgi:RNA polymerase sigma-70 factor (ECF subfamily)
LNVEGVESGKIRVEGFLSMKYIYDNKRAGIDDESVIGSILGGRKEMFGILVDRYGNEVLQAVGRVITSPEDAEETVQDCFVAVYRNLASFDRTKASFKTWLMRIAYYTALKRLRGKSGTPVEEVEWESLDHIPDADADMMLNDSSPRRLSLLNKAIALLSADDRLLLSLYYHDDRPIREIAFITNRTEGYLRSRLQWLRKKLCQTIKSMEQNGKE